MDQDEKEVKISCNTFNGFFVNYIRFEILVPGEPVVVDIQFNVYLSGSPELSLESSRVNQCENEELIKETINP